MSYRDERLWTQRFWAALVGLPLVTTLFVPWIIRGEEFRALAMAETMEHPGWALMPFYGIAFLCSAFVPMKPILRRSVIASSGVLMLVTSAMILRSESISWHLPDPILQERELTTMLLFWIIAAGMEIALHARPRSRGVAFAALGGWSLALLSFAIPIGEHGEWDESVYGQVLDRIDHHSFDEQQASFLVVFSLFVVGWLQALRRIGKDRDKAAKKRFRTSWLIYLTVPIPFLGVYGMVLVAGLDRPELLAEFHNAWSFLFAGTFGGALGLASTAALLSGAALPLWVKRATFAGVAGALLFSLVLRLLPDARESHTAEFIQDIGEATIKGLRGEPVPSRFLGGYEEFDLRAGPAALDGVAPAGAPLRLVATALQFRAGDRNDSVQGWAIVMDDELRWFGTDDNLGVWSEDAALRATTPELADFIGYAFEASASCLPAPSEAQQELLRSGFDDHLSYLGEAVCSTSSRSSRFFNVANPIMHGGAEAYRVLVEFPSGETRTFEGRLLFDGRTWVGPPSLRPL